MINRYFISGFIAILTSLVLPFSAKAQLANQLGQWVSPSYVPPLQVSDLQDIKFIDANNGWAVIDGLSNTTDGGITWKNVSVPFTLTSTVLDFVDNQNGWVAGADTIYHTTNGGASWVAQPVNFQTNSPLAIKFVDANNGWAVGWLTRIYRTTNGGTTWQLQHDTIYALNLVDVDFVDLNNGWAVGSGLVYHTTNGGTTWQLQSTTIGGTAVHALNATTAWILGPGQTIYKTTNGGTIWTGSALPSGNSYNDVKFLDATNGFIAAGGDPSSTPSGSVLRTTDGGVSWQTFSNIVRARLNCLSVTSTTQVWLGGQGAVLRTLDGGTTWEIQAANVLDGLYEVSSPDGANFWAVGENTTIMRSTDAGKTWQFQLTASPTFFETFLGVHFATSTRGWAVGGNGTIRFTSNGGTSWQSQTSGTTYGLTDIFFTDQNNGWICGGNGTILRTTNGGSSWQVQSSGTSSFLQRIVFLDNAQGYAVGDNIVLKTTNGGTNWNALAGSGSFSFNSVSFVDVQRGWICAWPFRILKTSDDGTNWTTQYNPGVQGGRVIRALDSLTAIASGAGVTVATADGGANWNSQTVPSNPDLHGISIRGFNDGVGVGGKTIIRFLSPPNPPQSLTATAGNAQATLRWNKNTEPDFLRYRIYRGTSPNPVTKTDSTLGGINDTTKTITGLTNGTTYYFRITALDSAGNESGYSNEVSATPTASAFTDISASLIGVYQSSVSWGDYDNDGDLDILLTGQTASSFISKVYRNDSGSFFDISASLTGVYSSSVAWGDYDNDGDLDILLTGADAPNNPLSKVYRNDNGSFVDISANLTGVWHSSVAWGDYDNDGDLDILLTGSTTTGGSISKVYRNDNGSFVDISAGLTGGFHNSVAWGDYDNDGDLDILFAGLYGSTVYRNDSGSFVDISANLTGVEDGSVAWGDYDNDGHLDILLTGYTSSTYISRVYRNDNGSFVDISANLTGVRYSSVAWGDYDSDGDLDILLTGTTDGSPAGAICKVYRNDSGAFVDISAGLVGAEEGSIAWGDYDNDGDLDILLTGQKFAAPSIFSKIYRNNIGTANALPSAPTNLTSSNSGNTATLRWNRASDAQTAQKGLTYNLRVGTTLNGIQKISPMADLGSGYRRVSRLGNTNHDSVWTVKNLAEGAYTWSVQAIDNAFAGSTFASEQSLTIAIPPVTPQNLVVTDSSVGRVTLKWGKNTETDFLRYRIYYGASPGTSTPLDSSGTISDTSKTITGLTNGVRYYFRVTAIDVLYNESGYSNEVNAKPGDYVPPAAPLNLVATDSSSGTIIIKWRKNTESDFLRYRIYRGTSPSPTTKIDSTTGGISDTSKTFTGLTNGVRYYFRVTAVDSSLNESAYSNEVNAVPADRLAPSAPQNLAATAESGQVTLRWRKNTEPDFLRYRIYGGTSPNPITKTDSTTGGIIDTTKIITGLTNGTTYYFRITAVDSAGNESGYSNEVSATPSVLTAFKEYNPDANTVLLLHMNETSGTTVSDASSYANNGTATGTTIVDGRFGKTRIFSGTNEYILVSNTSSLNPGTDKDFTIECWMKYTGSQNASTVGLIAKAVPPPAAYRGYELAAYNNKAEAIVGDGIQEISHSSGLGSLISSILISDGGWHHVALVLQRASSSAKLFVNGSLEAAAVNFLINNSLDNTNPLTIGSTAAVGGFYFKGLIDEVRISNKARSPNEFNLQLPPRSLTASASGTTINLSWQNGGGAVPLMRYKIYRGLDSTNVSLIDSTVSTSYPNTNLAQGTYFYRVSAVDSTGFESARSYAASASITGTPPIPSLATPADSASNQDTRPTLAWNVSAGATKYHLQVSQSVAFSTTVYDDSTITTRSRQVGPLQNNRTHYWRVRAANAVGWSSFSTSFSFSTAPPPAFSTISIRKSFASPGSRPTGFAWDGANLWMIDNLKTVYKMDTSGTVLGSFIASGFPDNDLTWDGTGLWVNGGRVRKLDTLGNQIDSLDVNYWANSGFEWDGKFFWVGDYNFSVLHKHRKDGAEVLSFSVGAIFGHPTGISYDGVSLWVGTSSEGTNDLFKFSTTGTTLYSFNLGTLGINFGPGSFMSVAWDGQSLWLAGDDQFTIYRLNVPYYHTPLASPVLVSPADSATNQPLSITLAWQQSLDAATYRLQVSTSSSFTTRVFDDSTITGTSQQISGLVNGTRYYWRVNAKNSGGTSSFSSSRTFTTVYVPPATPSLVSPVNGAVRQPLSLTLRWNSVQSATSYKVELATDTNFVAVVLGDTSVADTTKNVSGLANGTTYYWRVKAKNPAGESAYSVYSAFTTTEGKLHVSTTGNDANAGTAASPLRNIQTALNRANAGDTIKISTGFYNEALMTQVSVIMRGGYTGSFLETERDIFVSKTFITAGSPVLLTDQMASTIEGFIFSGNANVTDAAIKVYNTSVVQHNIVRWTNASFAAGIKTNGGATVMNNTISRCYYGIEIRGGTGTPVIKNNIITYGTFGTYTIAYSASVRSYIAFFGNSFSNYSGTYTNAGVGDINTNPQYKDTASVDYRIIETSLMVDAGDPTNPVGNEPVPYNTRIDPGAYGGTQYSPYIYPRPSPPILVSPSNGVTNQPVSLTLRWNKSTGAFGYRLQVGTDSTFASGITIHDSALTSTDTSRSVSGLAYGVIYYWRVSARNTSGVSAFSNVFNFKTTEGKLHVSTAGNDANPGTAIAPLRNIQTALLRAVPGDTIKVAGGTYNEGLVTQSRVVLLGGYSSSFTDRSIFQNKTIINAVGTIMYDDSDSSTVDGFIFDGRNTVAEEGLRLSSGSIATHNIVRFVRSSVGYGIYITGGAQVVNNIVVNCIRMVDINTGSGTPIIKNNIIAYGSFGLLHNASSYPTSIRSYNNVYQNVFNYTGNMSVGTGDISANPQFRDTSSAALDYRILDTSPCVDAGDLNDPVGDEPPPGNTRIDMGAYGGTAHTPYRPGPPLAPTLSSPADGAVSQPTTITLSWNSAATATAYRVQVSLESNFATIIVSDSIPGTSRVVSGLSNGSIYYWRVQAMNISGAGPFSEARKFTTVGLFGELNPDANTVLLLHMNEASGTSVSDISAYGNSGTATGTTIVDGRFGKARQFSTNADTINVPRNNIKPLVFTVESWINVASYSTASPQFIVSNLHSGVDKGFFLVVQTDGRLHFNVGNGPNNHLYSTSTISPNMWYHVAGTFDGSTMRVFIDGMLEGTSNWNNIGYESDDTFPLKLGNHNLNASDPPNQNFNGLIDEVRISNIARPPNEFNLQLPPKNLTVTASGSTINFSWQNGGGAVPLMKYMVYRGSDSVNVIIFDSTANTSHSRPISAGDDTSYYRISAVDSTGFEGVKSYAAKPAVVTTAPLAPSNLTATAFSSTQINLSWADNSDNEEGFKIERKIGSAGTYSEIATVILGVTTYQNIGLSEGTTYFYRVHAYNAIGNSDTSNEASATTPDVTAPSAPTGVSISPNGWTNSPTFMISWNNPSDPSGISKMWYRLNAVPTGGVSDLSVNVLGNSATVIIAALGSSTVYFYLEDGAGNKNAANYATVVARFDNVAPSLTHDSSSVLPFNTQSPLSIAIQATASDANSDMKRLQLQYRRSGTSWSSATTDTFQNATGGTAFIQVGFINQWSNFGVDYRVVATDNANNQKVTPTFSIAIRVPTDVTRTDQSGNPVTQTSTSSLPSNTPLEYAYRMFSVPLNLDNKTPTDVLEAKTGLPSYDPKLWRFFSLNTSDGFDEYPTLATQLVIEPGNAFFLILKSGMIIRTGPGSIVKADSVNKVGIQLRAGNNFVGNPFNFSVPIDSLSLSNGDQFAGRTWEFVGVGGTNGGWSLNPAALKPWEGILVRTSSSADLKFNITDRPRSQAFPSRIADDEGKVSGSSWKVRINAKRTDNGLADVENIAGVESKAADGIDELDAYEPPLFGEKTLSLNFPSSGGALTHDIRPTNEEGYIWDFKVQTPDHNAKVLLSFEGIGTVGSLANLIDLDTRMPHKLSDDSRIEINTFRGERKFRLIIGSLEFARKNSAGIDLVPREFALYQNYPNPFNPETVIRYSLPTNSSTFVVSLKVYNLLGQEVTTLVEMKQGPGFYEAKLDGRVLSSGAYFYRIVATGETREASYTSVKRMMLLR